MARALRYIAIEGPIGVGKTSLALRLAETLQFELVLERAEENPFLERFYRDPVANALPTQLHFLFQRARQAQEMRQADLFAGGRVADFLLEKDRIFARLTLPDEEYRLYEQVYQGLALDAPTPDLVIYLQAPVDVLLDRVQRRGIPYEQSVRVDYLRRLSEAYMDFFHRYDAGPLLIVNAALIDPVRRDDDYRDLLARIHAMEGGRQYYNPAPFGEPD
ncbi:MAG TPA: deoxynucleoside kinase [Gammaproteobacteria bacterium]|nr:deoxynucleoside kinase [Gammaproteobacteria bacterium]